jgi:GNAT superfamily N-acetyltransferase
MRHYHTRPIAFATPAYDEAIALRYEVLRKPLGLDFTPEQLGEEVNEFHFGCYDDFDTLCGCLTYQIYDTITLKMRQVAVLPTLQGKGIGKILVQQTEQWARYNGWRTILLHARLTAVPFYEKLEYEIEGDVFEEVSVPHFKMKKKLAHSF